jgi:hypothetical protein
MNESLDTLGFMRQSWIAVLPGAMMRGGIPLKTSCGNEKGGLQDNGLLDLALCDEIYHPS